MRRGFKAQAERQALTLREALGLDAFEPLDPLIVAEHLGIHVASLSELATADPASITHFMSMQPEEFSALTLTLGSARLVVYNPTHSAGRRANSIMHELSHVILQHAASPPIGMGGCRIWDAEQEDEADYLAGALLVPRPAALRVARALHQLPLAAGRFGVSEQLMSWRVYGTGAAAQVTRAKARG